jgi:hypothetical protein
MDAMIDSRLIMRRLNLYLLYEQRENQDPDEYGSLVACGIYLAVPLSLRLQPQQQVRGNLVGKKKWKQFFCRAVLAGR